ncbi:MAG: iron transporter [Blastopirellula sp.]|nr:MAG: iron transporter [Blastopirellula sp.]
MSDLSQAKVGDTFTVQNVTGDDAVSVRLMEMGITPGIEVSVIGCAPLGDPIEIEIRGYRLSLRRTEAACVVCDPA